jgi:hypothetical protein
MAIRALMIFSVAIVAATLVLSIPAVPIEAGFAAVAIFVGGALIAMRR